MVNRLPMLLLLLCPCAALVVGCGRGGGNSSAAAPTEPAQGVTLHGLVHSGSTPIIGARIYLYSAGGAGYGSASMSLLHGSMDGASVDKSGNAYVTTDDAGTFQLTNEWSCSHPTDQVYILSLGGNAGPIAGANNTALALMAALGTCSTLDASFPAIVINEVTTVASVGALQQFTADATHVGSSTTNAQGLANAFAQVPNLVSTVTGQALAKTPGGNGTVPRKELNTLANMLVPCVHSSGSTSTECSSLFSAATPAGEAPVSDTIRAALSIARHPGSNVAGLFTLSTVNVLYAPQLASAPNDWMLYVTFTGGGLDHPASLGVDGSSNLWVANYAGVASEFSPTGTPMSTAGYTGSGLRENYGMAIDIHGNIWFANEQSTGVNSGLGSVTELNAAGEALSGAIGYSAGGIYFPVAVAADPNGNMWIVDYGDSRVTLLDSLGTPLSGASGWGGTSLEFPVALAVDSQHNAWVANQPGTTITRLSADGASRIDVSCCDGASGLAVDQGDNVWVANYYGDSISEVTSSGTVLLNGATGGGVVHPLGIAVDGAGAVWITNYRGNSLSEITATSGAFLSPPAGFGTGASLLEPYGIALDASGNAWVSSFGNDTVTQFIGVATPIKTPFAGPPSRP